MFLHFSVTSRSWNKFTTLSLFPLEDVQIFFTVLAKLDFKEDETITNELDTLTG